MSDWDDKVVDFDSGFHGIIDSNGFKAAKAQPTFGPSDSDDSSVEEEHEEHKDRSIEMVERGEAIEADMDGEMEENVRSSALSDNSSWLSGDLGRGGTDEEDEEESEQAELLHAEERGQNWIPPGADEGNRILYGCIPRRLLGLCFVLISGVLFSLMGLLVHYLGVYRGFGAMQLGAVRFFEQLLIVGAWLWWSPPSTGLLGSVDKRKYLFARGFFGSLAMLSFYFGLANLPIGDATSLMFTNPIMTTILASLVLKEHFSWMEGSAALLCFVGVVLVARPTFLFGGENGGDEGGSGLPRWLSVMIALTGALFASFSFLSIRKVGKGEPTSVLVFYFAVIGLVVSSLAMLALESWVTPQSTTDVLALVAIGILGYVGQMFINRGMQLEKAGPAATMRNVDVALAVVYQSTFLGEGLPWSSGVGALLITIGTIAVAWRKQTPATNNTPSNQPSATRAPSPEFTGVENTETATKLNDFDVDLDWEDEEEEEEDDEQVVN